MSATWFQLACVGTAVSMLNFKVGWWIAGIAWLFAVSTYLFLFFVSRREEKL